MNGNYQIQEIDPWPQIDIKSGLDHLSDLERYCFEAKEPKKKAKIIQYCKAP